MKGSEVLSRGLAGAVVLLLAAASARSQDVHVVPRVDSATTAPAGVAPTNGVATPPGVTDLASVNIPSAGRGINVNVDLVLVAVTITDPMDRLVTGLEQEQFSILEDKTPQKIKTFSNEDAPISVGLIFDTSGSMSDKIQKSREAVSQFFKTANPQDEFFLIDFSDKPRLLCDFTTNVDDVQNRIAFVQPRGRTALLDAVYLALEKMRSAHNTRKALLIISDGGDNHSRYTENEIRNVVRETDVQIYAVGIFSPAASRGTPEEAAGPGLLSDISEATGGREFAIDDINELPDVATKIGIELRNQYVLGYTPSNRTRNGKWRKIKVKLNPPPGLPPLTVYSKTGYYAPGR